MKSIYKYTLNMEDQVDSIFMPIEAQILSTQMQNGNIVMWVLIDTKWLKVETARKFVAYGTGWDMHENEHRKYIATVQDPNGFVWHVFEE